MPISNYGTFLEGVTIRGTPITQLYPGTVFWVNNSGVTVKGGIAGSDSNPGTYVRPFATIAAAEASCTAGRGDIICVMPGHAETISSATALLLNLSNIAIVGIGIGTKRPTLTFDTATTAAIPVSAADVCIKNIAFVPNFADIVAFITTTTAKNLIIEDCVFGLGATNMNALSVVKTSTTDNAADGLTLLKNTWIEPDTATLNMVTSTATIDRLTVEGNFVNLGVKNNTPALVAMSTTKIATNLNILDNRVFRLNTDTATGGILMVTDVATNTGIVARNFAQTADTAGEILVTASSGLGFFLNYASGVQGASGYLLPASDS